MDRRAIFFFLSAVVSLALIPVLPEDPKHVWLHRTPIVLAAALVVLGIGWVSPLDERSTIELLPPFDERALRGLDDFSHCIVVYVFDRATWDESRMVRHPRGNPEWPEVGILAQRAKDRPNRIGVTTCPLVSATGLTIEVIRLTQEQEPRLCGECHGDLQRAPLPVGQALRRRAFPARETHPRERQHDQHGHHDHDD